MNFKILAALIALSLPLAGCGNKGSLVLPTAAVSEGAADASAAAPTPVDETGNTTDAEEVIESDVEADAATEVDAGSNDEAGSEPPPR